MTEQQRKLSRESFFEKVKQGLVESITDKKEFKGHKVGDLVLIKNAYGLTVGPFEILGFDNNNKIFLDWDCNWFTVPVDRIIKKVESDE